MTKNPGYFGASWRLLKSQDEPSEGVLGAFSAFLERLGRILEASLEHLEAPWGHLRVILETFILEGKQVVVVDLEIKMDQTTLRSEILQRTVSILEVKMSLSEWEQVTVHVTSMVTLRLVLLL